MQPRPSSDSLSRLASIIPKDTWDAHMHVVDPTRFPLASNAQYQPSSHTIDQAKSFLSKLGISKMVIVQPSIYGNDNSCTLEGLNNLGVNNGRAIIQFDPDLTSREQLKEWHDRGVRGVRLNFKSVGAKLESTSLTVEMRKYADAIPRDWNWILELYVAMDDLPLLEPIIQDLNSNIKICIDHYAHPSEAALSTAQTIEVLPGFASLAKLLKRDNIWVKTSAAYRLNKDPTHPLVQSLARWILRTRPDRCVFATDWPHTRFEDVDVTVYLEEFVKWCKDEGVSLQMVMVDNAKKLFDVD